jgi:small GTP-binding protein
MARCKVVLAGDSGVGKSCIVSRALDNRFEADLSSTIGANQRFLKRADGTDAPIEIWDTAGQEKYRAITPMYFQGASAAILCFDLTRRSTVQSLTEWVTTIRNSAPGCEIIILGNKLDLPNDRVVEYAEAQDLQFKLCCTFYIEVSAKTGQNIGVAFERLEESLGAKLDLPDPAKSADGSTAVSLTDTGTGYGIGCC